MIELQSTFSRLRARLSGSAGDDRGVAMLTAIMFMIIMAGITTVLLSLVVNQVIPSYLSQKSTKTINAAQAGMQSALGTLRAVRGNVSDGAGSYYGDPTKLPCSLSGNVNGAADGISYTVTYDYFIDDPTNQSVGWQTSHKLTCGSITLANQPLFALIVAKGISPAVPGVADATTGNRSISAIYKFRVTNVNNPGGRIYDLDGDYCLQAASAATGQKISFASNCSTNDNLQMWIYDTDYEIKLASTVLNGAPGLCITGPVNDGDSAQDALLRPCKAKTDVARWNQLWSWVGEDLWRGQKKALNPNQDPVSNYCLSTGYSSGTGIATKKLRIETSCAKGGGFQPTADVGAGAASYATHQLVNYLEFGRCADITGEAIGTDHLIAYPCKQDTTGTSKYIKWNHKWYYNEPPTGTPSLANQQIYVYKDDDTNQKYCLYSPPTASAPLVVFKTCDTSNAQKWKRVYSTGVYATSYLFVDTYGRCLGVDQSDPDGGWSKLKVTGCNGSDAQKWNAPPSYTDSSVGGYREVFQ